MFSISIFILLCASMPVLKVALIKNNFSRVTQTIMQFSSVISLSLLTWFITKPDSYVVVILSILISFEVGLKLSSMYAARAVKLNVISQG